MNRSAILKVGLGLLALVVVVYFHQEILLFGYYCSVMLSSRPVLIEGKDLQFAPYERSSKRLELTVESPYFVSGRHLSLTVSKNRAQWRLVGPGGRSLTAFTCSEIPGSVQGIPEQTCFFTLGGEHQSGSYQLEVKSSGSPAPTYAIFSYGRDSRWLENYPYQGKGWPESWVRVDRDPKFSPVAGQEWTTEFALDGKAPEGELDVETTVEYLPAMPSGDVPASRVEHLHSVMRGGKGEVKFVPPAGGALRVTHRVTSTKRTNWVAYGASDWLPVRQRAAVVSAVRAWRGYGLEVDLDVEVAGTYQFRAEVDQWVSDNLPWQDFPLRLGRQTVKLLLPGRTIIAMSDGRPVELRALVQLKEANFPVDIDFAEAARRQIHWDQSTWRLEPDLANRSATARPLKLEGNEKAQLVEVTWEMESKGGYCLAYGRLISKATGKGREVVVKGMREILFARVRVQLVFPVPAFGDATDQEWDFEGLQVCNPDSYPAQVRHWEANSRFRLQLKPTEFAVDAAKGDFEVREIAGLFPYDLVRNKPLPARFAVGIYAKGPFDRSARLSVGDIEKGFRVSTSDLTPFRSADVPVANVFVEPIRGQVKEPLKTRYFPILVEGSGMHQELIVVCPFTTSSALPPGTLVRAR